MYTTADAAPLRKKRVMNRERLVVPRNAKNAP